MGSFSTSGYNEAGLETIRMSLNTAPTGNLNIAYRSNSKIVLILLTGNSPCAIHFFFFFFFFFFFIKYLSYN